MVATVKKQVRILTIGFLLTLFFILFKDRLPFASLVNLKLYDALNGVEYRLRKPPPQIGDIVIVAFDNETASKMPFRWPYPRSIFADVIKNLAQARAKVIAFDFVFLGRSEEAEDEMLAAALANNNDKVILASAVDENGLLKIRSLQKLDGTAPSGIVTKLQDADGSIRQNLTYLVTNDIPPKGFLAWEMEILKVAEGLRIAPVKGNESCLSIKNNRSEKWLIPVDCCSKSFIINFRANIKDFKLLSFYDVYKGDFTPDAVRDKIVLAGFTSPLLGDIHNTPIGWMPGVILNANSLLTLYTREFIAAAPPVINGFLTMIGVVAAIMVMLLFNTEPTKLFIVAEIALFFIMSYALLTMGYIWDYFTFPFSVAVFPFLSRKIYSLVWQRKKFYWT